MPTPSDRDLIIANRIMAGERVADIATEIGIGRQAIYQILEKVRRYRIGLETLNRDPGDLQALARAGRIPRRLCTALQVQGITQLGRVAQMTRRELSYIPYMGRAYVAKLEALLAEFGLTLRPDKPRRRL